MFSAILLDFRVIIIFSDVLKDDVIKHDCSIKSVRDNLFFKAPPHARKIPHFASSSSFIQSTLTRGFFCTSKLNSFSLKSCSHSVTAVAATAVCVMATTRECV